MDSTSNKFYSWSKTSDVTSEVRLAFEKFYDPAIKRQMRRRAASEDGYGAYELSMIAGYADEFKGLFDFFVNLPGVDKTHRGKSSFVWETLKSDLTIDEFLENRSAEMMTLLDLAKGPERILAGYVVFSDRGQLDEITTWSRTHWILATERSFVSIEYYATVIH